GGVKLNLPLTLKWGSFNLGNDHLKLKKLFILSIARPTASRADSIVLVIVFLIPFQIVDVVFLIVPQAPVTVAFTVLTALLTTPLMPSQTPETVSLIVFQKIGRASCRERVYL